MTMDTCTINTDMIWLLQMPWYRSIDQPQGPTRTSPIAKELHAELCRNGFRRCTHQDWSLATRDRCRRLFFKPRYLISLRCLFTDGWPSNKWSHGWHSWTRPWSYSDGPGQLCFVLLQWWRKLPTSALVVDQVVPTQKCTPEWPELMIWELQTKRPQLDLTSARVNRQYTIYRPPARPKQIPLCSEGVSPTLHTFAWSDSHLKISHQTGSLGVSGT